MLENKDNSRTELSTLGEFGLIDHLTQNFPIRNSSTLKGIGDDAAVIKNEGFTLVSTDILIEGIHFDLMYMPLKHLGYKAAVVNFSDIAAMNGQPKQLLVGISVSNRFSMEALDEIYEGIRLACEKYQVDLVGGDTTASSGGLFLSLTVIGEAKQENIVYRNTAQENDLICVSGDLGAAYMGLLVLEREKQVFKANPNVQPELEGHDYILQRQLKPEARTDVVKLLAENEILPTSLIDISDGLASDILHICKQSQVGCRIYEEKIPIDHLTAITAAEFNISPVTAALNGGEDYELLFTVDQKYYGKIKELQQISMIGHVTGKAAGSSLVTTDNNLIELKAQGWNHLK